MRIEVTDLVPSEELEPGDIYSNKPQEWWDLSLASPKIGVELFVRSEFVLPEAYLGTSTYRIIIHKDEEGVAPSGAVHIVDEEPAEVSPEESDFHCKGCNGMGVGDGGPCKDCNGTGVTPQ